MAKENATLKRLEPWDAFLGKPADQVAALIYKHAEATYTTVAGWYWQSIGTKRRTALITRSLTMLLVIGAAILQALATSNASADARLSYTLGVLTMLTVAGLVQLADRVFGWSSGWTRYMSTATAIEARTRQLQRDWNSAILPMDLPLQPSNSRDLYELVKCYEADVLRMQSDETQAWVVEFNNGSAALADAMTALRGQNRDAFNRNPAAPIVPTGALQLSFQRSDGQPLALPLSITIDNQPAETCANQSWATLLAPGPHTVTVTSNDHPSLQTHFAAVIAANTVTSQAVVLA